MSDHELVRYADLIAGSYLWAGSPADVFITQRTTQQARRDKTKTQEYRQKNYRRTAGRHPSKVAGSGSGSPQAKGMCLESGQKGQRHDLPSG